MQDVYCCKKKCHSRNKIHKCSEKFYSENLIRDVQREIKRYNLHFKYSGIRVFDVLSSPVG